MAVRLLVVIFQVRIYKFRHQQHSEHLRDVKRKTVSSMVDLPLSTSTSQALFCVLFVSNQMQLGLQRLTSLRHFTISFKNYRFVSRRRAAACESSFYIYNLLSRTSDGKGFQHLSSLQSLHLAEVP